MYQGLRVAVKTGWEVVVMGSGQDAGVPQVGCFCRWCTAARSEPALRRLASSLLLKNEEKGEAIVIDASPDIREQLDRYLPPLTLRSLRAVFITHGHVGHYWGLALLGKEGPDLRDVGVYATSDTVDMLRTTPALSFMESRGNVRFEPIQATEPSSDDASTPLYLGDVSIRAFIVPHRQELTGAVGFVIRGPRATLVYIPDVDRWTPDVLEVVRSADLALIDGTFFSREELGGSRTMHEIPHPPIVETVRLLADPGGSRNRCIYFTHLNHTNPSGLDGPEKDQVLRAGLGIAFDGMTMRI